MLFMGRRDIATCFGVTIKTISNWQKQGFPKQIKLRKGSVWYVEDILEWAKLHKKNKMYLSEVAPEKMNYDIYVNAFNEYKDKLLSKAYDQENFYFSKYYLNEDEELKKAYKEYRKERRYKIHKSSVDDSLFLTINDLMKLLSLSRQTIYKIVKLEDFPKGIKLGNKYLYKRSEIMKWIFNRKEK